MYEDFFFNISQIKCWPTFKFLFFEQSWLLTWGFYGKRTLKSGAAQRALSEADSWLSTSPVVCVLTRQCPYPRRQNTAWGPKQPSQPSENPPPSPGPWNSYRHPWSRSWSASWSAPVFLFLQAQAESWERRLGWTNHTVIHTMGLCYLCVCGSVDVDYTGEQHRWRPCEWSWLKVLRSLSFISYSQKCRFHLLCLPANAYWSQKHPHQRLCFVYTEFTSSHKPRCCKY